MQYRGLRTSECQAFQMSHISDLCNLVVLVHSFTRAYLKLELCEEYRAYAKACKTKNKSGTPIKVADAQTTVIKLEFAIRPTSSLRW